MVLWSELNYYSYCCTYIFCDIVVESSYTYTVKVIESVFGKSL